MKLTSVPNLTLRRQEEGRPSPATAWKRLPGDPTTVWGWIFQKRFVMSSFDAKQFWRVLAIEIVVLVGLAAFIRSRGEDLSGLLVPVVLFGGSLLGMFRWRLTTSEAHAALPTLTEAREALPVLLTVQDGMGRVTGRDHGWVAFADGWLIYEGLRTEFTLTKAAVDHPEYLPNEMVLRTFDGRRLTFKCIAPGGAPGTVVPQSEGRLLAERFRTWRSEPIPDGLSTLPPRAVHPEVARERLAFPPVYALAALFLAMISNALFLFGPELAWAFVAAAVGCVLWTVAGLVRFARRLPTMIQ